MNEARYIELMRSLNKFRASLSSEAYCLATDIALAWLDFGCPAKFQITYLLAVESGYAGTDKTYRKCVQEFIKLGVLPVKKLNAFNYYIEFYQSETRYNLPSYPVNTNNNTVNDVKETVKFTELENTDINNTVKQDLETVKFTDFQNLENTTYINENLNNSYIDLNTKSNPKNIINISQNSEICENTEAQHITPVDVKNSENFKILNSETKPQKEKTEKKQREKRQPRAVDTHAGHNVAIDLWHVWVKAVTGGMKPELDGRSGKSMKAILTRLDGFVETNPQLVSDYTNSDFVINLTATNGTILRFDLLISAELKDYQSRFLGDVKARATVRYFTKLIGRLPEFENDNYLSKAITNLNHLSDNLQNIILKLKKAKNGNTPNYNTHKRTTKHDPNIIAAELQNLRQEDDRFRHDDEWG